MRVRLMYGIVPMALLAACSVGPDYKRPEFWDKQALESSLGVVENNYPVSVFWYQAFGDETLNWLVGEALRSSPNVKIALSRLHQARYSLNINRVEYWPTIDANGSYNYAYAPKYAELGDKTSYFRGGLDASWEIDIWGGGRRQTESYMALYKAAADNFNDVLLSMTAEVANTYILLRTMQEQLRISNENLKLQQDILATVQAKYKSGLADDAALHQAEYAVQTTKALIPDLEYQEQAYKNALAILLGRLPDSVDGLELSDINPVAVTFNFDLDRLAEFPLDAVRNRPDVRAAENMLISKNADIGRAVAAMFPSVSISAALGWQGHLFRDLGRSENAAYGYTPAISLPLFHWGALVNQVKLSKSVKEEYVYSYQNALLNAAEEIKNSMVAVEREYEKNTALQKSASSMKKVLSSMKVKYKEGLIEFSDLLSTEQRLLEVQNNLAASRGAVYQKIISFYKAVGGGY
uniref:Uncharacterized protein n=1 Tax=uncultured Alphaproteobacteria bacterium TaxID=91750 RepID=A0A6G8F215_9PROT|nr:RND efflux system, hypothetical protein, NodT [uncultured Alphaproteobacteria bacterium]